MSKNDQIDSKRRFLAALAGGALAAPAMLAGGRAEAATVPPFTVRLAPRYYPKAGLVPEINLAGKVAVITGASRGIGLAVGLALQAQGVQVIGTSRAPQDYPGHPFPLLQLDLVNPVSIQAFTAAVLSRPEVLSIGGIDILVNNAGRDALGGAIPVDPNIYFTGIQTAMATLYSGHVAVTSSLLQAIAVRAAAGYARILFTASVSSYMMGGFHELSPFLHAYTAGKRALLAYANELRTVLNLSGTGIKVSTLNPFFVNTDLLKGTRSIYLQPTNSNGDAINDPIFQLAIDTLRSLLANGLSTSYVAQAYLQLLAANNPEMNVVVGSKVEPYASQSQNDLVVDLLTNEMNRSAFPWVAGPSQV